jgi:ATP-dependent helicase/nuclease subunit A
MRRRPSVPDDTRAAQAKAATPGLSAWVSANAGSGKTHVLAQRVIRLLLDGADPSRILCLTYTRAAAANMAARVFQNLAGWTTLAQDELAGQIAALDGRPAGAARIRLARQLFARALETPGGLKIQTIHAFCEAVLHQFPLEANIAGHFELMDGQMEAALVAEARRQMIARAAGDEDPSLASAFATVLQQGGESGLDDLLRAIVGRRDELRRFIRAVAEGDGGLRALLAEFGFSPSDTPDSIADSIWPDGYFDASLARALASRAEAAGKATAAGFASDLAAACREQAPRKRLDLLRSLFLTRRSGGAWEPKSLRSVLSKGVAEHFAGFEAEHARIGQSILAACDRVGLRLMVEATAAALTIADWLIGRYERMKSARGLLDFNDLIARTAALLARQDAGAWVQYKLDRGIDHILLDEAQDTSPAQWAVVTALASEFFIGEGSREGVTRTVFAVGDEKQSIYSFQGARPESFALSGREFRSRVASAGERFEGIKLQRSFRSTWDVLSAVDLVFADPANREGLSVDDEPVAHLAIRDLEPGTVEVWPSLGPIQVEEPDDWRDAIDHASAPAVRLARDIARTVRHWLASGEPIEGQARPLTPGDVMVLVRKRDRFIHALGRELKTLGIPVAGADRLLLTGHIAVQDLLAVARICLQPQDDLSLAALLKSPLFAFDDDRFERLAAHRPPGASLWSALDVAASDDAELRKVADQLLRWRNEAGYGSPFAFFSSILSRDGARRRFIARLGPEAGDIVDEFLSFCLAAERTGVTELEALVALLDGGGPEIKREMDQARGEVRILTAHASKGLEAPVVFLVDSGSAAFSDSHLPRLMPFAAPSKGWPGSGFFWRASADMANGFARQLASDARVKAEQEYRRLLYVGMTRAEDRLIVCGYHGVRGQPERGWHAMVRDALTASPNARDIAHPVTGETILRYQVTPPGAAVEETAQAGPPSGWIAKPMPSTIGLPLPGRPRLPRPLVPSGATVAIEPELSAPSRSPVLDPNATPVLALERGTAVHRLLQTLPDMDAAARDAAAARYLARVGLAWPPAEVEAALISVRRVLADERFAPLFSGRSRAEVSIMGTVDIGGVERAVAGKIDRLAVDNGCVLIVDYKTNRPVPSSLAEVPSSHIAQMALYRALLRPLYQGRIVEAMLLYTEAAAPFLLPDFIMDDALARLTAA